MDLPLYSSTPPSGFNDSFGTNDLSSADSGIVVSTPRYFAPRGTSIDCRNLPRTSELVAKFEKNIQEYHSQRETGPSNTRLRSSSKSGNPSRVESFSLRQRQILYSPRSDCETEPTRSRRETKLRLRQDKPEAFDWESKRASCGLRIACPAAKSALFSGAKRPCVSPFSLQTDSILSSPRSQFLEASTTSDIETSSDNLALSNPLFVKPSNRMSPVTIVTTASNSHIPNMIMGNGSNSRAINSGSSMQQKRYYSSTDSGAETMTSSSNYDTYQSTPNTFPTNHSLSDLPANERITGIPGSRKAMEVAAYQRAVDFSANQSNVSRPTKLLTTETEDSLQPKTFRSSVTCTFSAKKMLNSSSDITERGESDSQQLKTPKSSIKTPTKIIRKTRLSNFAFCGLSKSCTKTTKIRDPYFPSPSQTPSTPITTPHRVQRLSGFETSNFHSLETSLNGSTNVSSSEMHTPVRIQVGAPQSELKYPKTVPPKKPVRASFIRPIRLPYSEDDQIENRPETTANSAAPEPKKFFASDFEIESSAAVEKREASRAGTMNSDDVRNAMKSLSLRSEDNLSFTTGDEDCELSSLAESFSSISRDMEQQNRSNVPALFSMPPPPSNLLSLASSLKHKPLSSQQATHPPTRPNTMPLPPNVLTPTVESTVTPQAATLVPNGVVLDEETFQRTMKDLNEMKVLLGTLMKSLHTNPLSQQCDSPLEEGLREDIYRRFTAQIRATLYQDASTQIASCDPDIPEPETETQFCVDSSFT